MFNFTQKTLVAVFTLAVVAIPNSAIAELYSRARWREHALYARTQFSRPGIGIGGLQVNIRSNLRLEPKNLSYRNGFLSANLGVKRRTVNIPISQIELKEVIDLVQQKNTYVLQTSIDRTVPRTTVYQSSALKETKYIKDLFLVADKEFAAMVGGSSPLPETRIVAPSKEALRLLDSDNSYRKLPTKWIKRPISWSQLFISFDPQMPKLVRMELKPQVLFMSPTGYPVEVKRRAQAIGERPYTKLREDFKKDPSDYLAVLPSVNRVAHVSAALGLVVSACQQPKSCQHLQSVPNRNEEANLAQEYRRIKRKSFFFSRFSPYSTQRRKLRNKWKELSIRNFKNSNSPKAWGAAYDAFEHYKRMWRSGSIYSSKTALNQARVLAKQQFLRYPIPKNDALLQAVATIFMLEDDNTDIKLVKKSLDKAIKYSDKYPGDRISVTDIGIFTSYLMQEKYPQESISIRKEMRRLRYEAILSAYDEVDRYLLKCMKTIRNCSSRDLRKWEADAARAGLNADIISKDIPWLYGRFAYLIGIKEPHSRANRLRLLSSYVELTKAQTYSQELRRLEVDLRKNK
ncbi:MAG: hypothetical protein QNJ55_30415 [Xenococcus sp. MO_188.B8]|nr:hypothetical protein [Xenococcus sp. MO_188.B8]